jgi:TolB-like protein/Tfp pilus assembly protein PilF/tRNA A-37 threonylcarbamoyl transferase component Bud32
VTIECPKCHFENSEESKYCSRCAAPLPVPKDISAIPTKTIDLPVQKLSRGSIFAGRYEIIEELGEGGMGKVYRVEDKKIHEEVALKLIRSEIAADKKTIERFGNELKYARKIAHRTVCKMYDLGEEGRTRYITMEYVPGENLRNMIRMMGQMSTGQVISIGKQVCEGLVEAHRLGVIHRDLKSSNIMIDKNGQPRIMDFGIARSIKSEGITERGMMVGTPEYISPEQVDGNKADERSDIYSLGVIMYEMATGMVPFSGKSSLSIALKHKTQAPADPRRLNPQIPKDLSLVILKCMEKERESRYQSAEELLSELEKLEKAVPFVEREVPAIKPTTLKDVLVTPKKHWVLIAALFTVIIMAGVSFLLFRKEEPAPPSSQQKMLVVIPFENLGPPEDEYFADGLTEEITSRLAALHGLGVISRTSSFQYKNTEKTIKQIGEELGVDYVLEGTVRWDRGPDGKGRVRVIPQLIRVSDDTHFWSERYDSVIEDIFSVQSEIAEQVIKQLDITVLEPEREALFDKPTEDLEAYDYYLRAIKQFTNAWLSQEAKEYEKTFELLDKAVERDPKFTLAFIYRAIINRNMYTVGVDRSDERLQKVKDDIDRALEIDPDLPEAQLQLAQYYVVALQDYEQALQILESVQRARPNISPYHLGYYQMRLGKWEQGLQNLERAFKLNPRSFDTAHMLGRYYAWIGKYDKSEQWFDRALSIYPNLYYSKLGLARLPLLSEGDTKQARILLEKLRPHVLTDYNLFYLNLYERNYQEALDLIANSPYEVFQEAHFYIPKDLAYAMVYSAMGDNTMMKTHADAVRIQLENAIEERPEDTRLYAALGLAYAFLGQKENAVREGNRAVNLYPISKDAFEGTQYILKLAMIYTVVGEFEDAVNQLVYLLSIPCGNVVSVPILRLDPIWDPLRNHPRFQQLLEENPKFE